MRKIIFLLVFLLALPCVFAGDLPDGYYATANGKSDSILKSTLSQIIRPHTVLSYGSGESSSWYCFYYSDRDPATGLCMDMYSDDWRPFTSPGSVVAGCNIEHSFAKSWWGGGKNDAYKDCFHLNPSNSTANSARSNYPLGIPIQDFKDQNTTGSLCVGKATYNGQTFFVFEPKDEYKGDFARAYFYMATCYGDELTWRKDNTDVGSYYAMRNPTDKDAYLEFLDWEIDILMKWHRQDPVSLKEINRADAVNNFQKNRNPFIDYPCLAEYIWGNKKGETVDFLNLMSSLDGGFLSNEDKSGCDCTVTVPTLTSPNKNAEVKLGNTVLDTKRSITLTIKGVLLTKDVTLSVSGVNAEYFSVFPTTISAAQALEGYNVAVSYRPLQLGEHSANLSIISSEFAIVPVTLSGSCGFEALQASDISEKGFTANWTSAGVDDYLLHVFVREVMGKGLDSLVYAPKLSSAIISGNDHLSIEGRTYDESDDALRLGTGSGDGSLVISGVDASRGAKLVIRAKKYGSDNASLKVSIGTTEVATKLLTEDYADYTFEINAGVGDKINITQGNTKKRLVISSVLLTVGGQTISEVSLEGFPKSVGNVLSYTVSAPLSNNRTYFYTVTPTGKPKSQEVKVEYLSNGISSVETAEIVCIQEVGNLRIFNLPEKASVTVYDMTGRLCAKRINCQPEEQFALTEGSVYILQISFGNRFYTVKTILL